MNKLKVSKKKKCSICNKKHLLTKIKLPKLKFITSDGKALSHTKTYSICPNTQFLYANTSPSWTKIIKKIYSNYELNFDGVTKGKTTREEIIATKVKKKLPNIKTILEIGPGSGALLSKLNNLNNLDFIDAMDLNTKNLKYFKKINAFRKFFKNIYDIKIKYDLIILSHSLFHITDLRNKIYYLIKQLNKNGYILIVNPDPLKYPILPFIYEIFSFSSKKNILSFFKGFGMHLKYEEKKNLKNELFLILKKDKIVKKNKLDKKFINNFYNVQINLEKKIKNLKNNRCLNIRGMGLKGNFLFLNLKNNVYKIFDNNLKKEKIINKSLNYIKNKKEIKSYKII